MVALIAWAGIQSSTVATAAVADAFDENLALEASFDTTTAALGDRVTLRLRVSNHHPTAARGVAVTVVLPDGLAFEEPPSPAQDAGPTRRWDIGTLEPDNGVALGIVLAVHQPGLTSTWVSVEDDAGRSMTTSVVLSTTREPGAPAVESSPSASLSDGPTMSAAHTMIAIGAALPLLLVVLRRRRAGAQLDH